MLQMRTRDQLDVMSVIKFNGIALTYLQLVSRLRLTVKNLNHRSSGSHGCFYQYNSLTKWGLENTEYMDDCHYPFSA